MKLQLNFILALAILLLLFTQGCASRKTTSVTKTEVQVSNDSELPKAGYADQANSQTTSSETTKTEEVHEDSHRGIFGILGDIIALPFRAVGAVLTAIF